MKRLIISVLIVLGLAPFAEAKGKKMEKDIDRMISRMTLEEKIGQMIQIEISKISWQNPEFDFYNVVKLGPDELAEDPARDARRLNEVPRPVALAHVEALACGGHCDFV